MQIINIQVNVTHEHISLSAAYAVRYLSSRDILPMPPPPRMFEPFNLPTALHTMQHMGAS
jgi:hypothetical protein